jgi:arylsulfatase A-like enzyme
MVHAYLASINFADYYVGQVLDALEQSAYADNTIIVLFSDHGYLLGEKNTFQKHSLWERANKVPLIFAGPGVTQGASREQGVGLIDIYPTLLDLSGLPTNPVNQGHSLTPIIDNADAAWDYPVITQLRRNDHAGQAIQSGPWRYSLYADGSEELYNHESDPNEWNNLAADTASAEQHRERMDDLKAQLPADFFAEDDDEQED